MNEAFLTQPVPIVFAVVQGYQRLDDGTFNLLGIFDRMTIGVPAGENVPAGLGIQIVTVWTGGRGDFVQTLRILDQDGNEVGGAQTPCSLTGTSARHILLATVVIPVRAGSVTIMVGRGDEELLRQDFTVEVQQAPEPNT